MTAENPPNTKRRRFQFSIRTMLIGFLVVAIMLGPVRQNGSGMPLSSLSAPQPLAQPVQSAELWTAW